MFLLLKLLWYFFHNFWAMWYIKTVYFSHEIKLDNADLIFKYFISFYLPIIFAFFLNIFRTPVLAGRPYEFMFASPSVFMSICPAVSRFSQESLIRLFWFFAWWQVPMNTREKRSRIYLKKIFCMCFKIYNYIRVSS